MKYNMKLFGDNASLFTVVCDPDQSAILLNHDLRIIEAWAYKWRMSFNPDPMKQAIEVIFSRKRTTVYHLGSTALFSCHIPSAISKARQGVEMLSFMSRYLPRKTLNELHKLYVRSHVDYGDVIYHIPPKKCDLTSSLL